MKIAEVTTDHPFNTLTKDQLMRLRVAMMLDRNASAGGSQAIEDVLIDLYNYLNDIGNGHSFEVACVKPHGHVSLLCQDFGFVIVTGVHDDTPSKRED